MKKITTIEELRAFLFGMINDIKETIQIFINLFEDMHEIIEELSEIPEEKETFFNVHYNAHYLLRKVKYKRLWKRQKIP